MLNSHNTSMENNPHKQGGVALATALIFLVIITVLGLVSVRSSTTELQLAHNAQVRIEAMQNAQSLIDLVLTNVGNLPGDSKLDYYACYESGGNGDQDTCPDANKTLTLKLPDSPTESDPSVEGCDPSASLFSTGVYVEARRLPGTFTWPGGEEFAFSATTHPLAYGVRGQYACGNTGLGSADIEQGILRFPETGVSGSFDSRTFRSQ